MNEPDYKHVLFKDLRNYLRKDNYLGGYTTTEQAYIRKNLGITNQEIKSEIKNVDYFELNDLIEHSSLIPGAVYVINNFQSIYSSNRMNNSGQYITYGNITNPSKIYTILAIAATSSKLFSLVTIVSGDQEWLGQYDPTPETLSDGEITKGKITYLQDNNNNEASFDFKNVRVYMNGKDYYTFSDSEGNDNSENCYNNNLLNSKNNIFIGNCSNNDVHGSNNFFSTPINYVTCEEVGLIFNKQGLTDNSRKQVIKYNNKYYLDYLDIETLTHQFYELAINQNFTQ